MSETSEPSAPEPVGLPPVVPPSGQYIAQLFVVPGLIVAGVVSALLFFSWMAGGSRTPEGFLAGLRDANPEVRWRTASDLAQVLLRDPDLASDPKFGVELTARLAELLPGLRKDIPPATPQTAASRREYKVQRSEAQYLAACLGHLHTPVGAKLLSEIADKQTSADPRTDALLRRYAVWALGEMGHKRQRFDNLPKERQDEILKELHRIAQGVDEKAEWARNAERLIREKSAGGVVDVLARCANSDDPFLRAESALALSFWIGSDADNATAEATLLRLTRDDGRGSATKINNED